MAAEAPQSTLPGPLRLAPSFPFVGRPRELATLRSLMPWAASEGRRIALVGGEAGSGKSRLVREFAAEAAAGGALVLYGACDAVVPTPYGPFAEALDLLVRAAEPEHLRADLGSGGGELRRLLPDLPARVGDLPEPVHADQDTERHRLHMAVVELLVATSRRAPVLLVLEDGHWADHPTLLLLRHLGRAAADARLLVVATFRDTEADVPQELGDALVDLRRSEQVARLRLAGLSAEDVEEFLRRAGGVEVDGLPSLAEVLFGLTNGNAFLLTEVWRALVETGAAEAGGADVAASLAALDTPEGVRDVVSQRLARLDPGTQAVLELAAVAGPEFETEVVRRAGALEPGALAAALADGVRSGMIEEVPGRTLAHRFTHELVRRALYDRLAAGGRAQLHLQIAWALDERPGERSARALGDIAHHFAAAAPIGGTDRAVEYSLLAAAASMAALAFDEAAIALRTALELGIPGGTDRADALLDLGAVTYRAGRSIDSQEAFLAAAEIARGLGDGRRLARAAVGYEDACWRMGIDYGGALELLEEAGEALEAGDSELRVRVLAALGRALSFAGRPRECAVVRDGAIAMARRIGDRQGLALVLSRSYWLRGPTPFGDILELLAEGHALAEALGDIEIAAEALQWRIASFIALGDLQGARAELALLFDVAGRMRQPFALHVAEQYAAAIALCDGRLGEAEAAAERSREWSRLLAGRDPSSVYGIQMFGIRREQGRLAELAPAVRSLASSDRAAAWRPGLAALMAELGMVREARAELDVIRAEGLDRLRPSLWLASLTYLADVCTVVGDAELAKLVYAELLPNAGSSVMIGHAVACYGAADRYLGMLAAAAGDRERAALHFEAALRRDRSAGASTWVAHTAFEYGRLLRHGGSAEDAARAAELLAEATELARRIGMRALLDRLQQQTGHVAIPAGLSPREVEILRLVARGLSNRDVGRSLSISEHTAANHIRSILRKTGAANRTEAAAYAHSNGLLGAG
ncbi:MAG TPA: AAA family ATPase [Gaiellales bacterium]|nr:AAA family ATPase [Gaiellales bacterium]